MLIKRYFFMILMLKKGIFKEAATYYSAKVKSLINMKLIGLLIKMSFCFRASLKTTACCNDSFRVDTKYAY